MTRRALESQRIKGTAKEGIRLNHISDHLQQIWTWLSIYQTRKWPLKRCSDTTSSYNTNNSKQVRWKCHSQGKVDQAAYRWKPGQQIAHTSFLFTNVNSANRCIKDGLEASGTRTYLTKLKQELAQCMKCRGWGHFANECNQASSTYGTCRGEHRTSNSGEENQRFCVSCWSNSHASWDRNCPEFIKCCAWYDDKHPNYTLKYFPTDGAWTQEARPARFPHQDHFPAHFAVTPIPPPVCNTQEQPVGVTGRAPKQHKGNRNLVGPGTS